MSGYTNDTDKLTQAGLAVTDTAQYIQGLRLGVVATVDELKATGWLGNASKRFQDAMDAWDLRMKTVKEDLEDIARKMNVNAIVYKANEDDVQAGMNAVDKLINTTA